VLICVASFFKARIGHNDIKLFIDTVCNCRRQGPMIGLGVKPRSVRRILENIDELHVRIATNINHIPTQFFGELE
jgi:hypothetical protein